MYKGFLKFKNKIACWVSDRKDDIDFLRRDDVSTLFKVLNLISGDRLRVNLCFANLAVRDIKDQYDQIAELKAIFADDLTIEEYDSWVQNVIGWYIDRAMRDCEDLWRI